MSYCLIFFGLFIRILSIKTLSGNYSWRLIKPEKIIVNGIYKYIRHPAYTGALLFYSGLCLLLTNNVGISIMMFLILLNFLLDRMDREEQILCYYWGIVYLKYIKKTKRLIPFLF